MHPENTRPLSLIPIEDQNVPRRTPFQLASRIRFPRIAQTDGKRSRIFGQPAPERLHIAFLGNPVPAKAKRALIEARRRLDPGNLAGLHAHAGKIPVVSIDPLDIAADFPRLGNRAHRVFPRMRDAEMQGAVHRKGLSALRIPDPVIVQAIPLQHEGPAQKQPRPHAQAFVPPEHQGIGLHLAKPGKPGIGLRVFARIFQIRNAFQKDANTFQNLPRSRTGRHIPRKTAPEIRCPGHFITLCSLSDSKSHEPAPPPEAPGQSRWCRLHGKPDHP